MLSVRQDEPLAKVAAGPDHIGRAGRRRICWATGQRDGAAAGRLGVTRRISSIPGRDRAFDLDGVAVVPEISPDLIEETGTRTYALSELMVRAPWRKTGTAKALHDALLTNRPEERAMLLVDQEHPKVHQLYQN
ncbi:hypothetical protein ABT024_35035 [Streptomyces sp. NPDC002812]|uniref:hypothetical protein n=1 Tax=Streptomyces sp. NPDC002812 TaxID=3154434 RepID=UPI00331EF35B